MLSIISRLELRLKKQDAEIEKLKQEKADAETARNEACSHRERNEQRVVRTYATLALKEKEINELTSLLYEQEQIKAELGSAKKDLQFERVEKAETSRRLVETEKKLENSETARVTAESQIEPLKNYMLWLKGRGIISVIKTVTHLLVVARNDGYAQGYSDCSQHVVNALKFDWDTSSSATHVLILKLLLPLQRLNSTRLRCSLNNLVAQLREVFPDREDDDDDEVLEFGMWIPFLLMRYGASNLLMHCRACKWIFVKARGVPVTVIIFCMSTVSLSR
ncbi:hypothetical protein Hanom_Chr01g00053811 [Helianthus anomalus]